MTMQARKTRRDCRYEVSAVVLTYHSDYAKLRQTLLSLILQEDVGLEIIVADDGSEENHRDAIEELFQQHGFSDYKLVMNPVNRGTIFNYISALEAAEGEFVKSLSPGDFLAAPDALSGWLKFMREKGSDWSFSEIINYHTEDGEERISTETAMPVYVKPYLEDDRKRARWNYVVLDDAAPGCAFMGRTELKLKYAKELADAGNKFGEDYLFRVMMFDGICGDYYPAATTFYEFATGISSGRSKEWTQLLFGEYLRMNRLMADRKDQDAFQRKMAKYVLRKTSAFAMLFVPGKLRRFLKLHLHPRTFPVNLADSEEWRRKCR